ncbi:MAG: hypothetical protein CVT88_04970 [Candidatus Altiarchaeales archaeon HGW-Altiarchaeales-1]|nr:MAG: hypothetical protein CVT88_04970 [Candidatus Altiarchaeales archaeon HGW-Altiarchaeales-1]
MAKAFGKKDKWKLKKKYKIILPEKFGSKEMGLVLSSDPGNLINRKVKYSIRDITQDKQKQHVNVTFKICEVKGDRALTVFDTLKVDRKYLMSRIVPGHTVIDQPFILKLKDADMMVAVNVLTAYKIHTSQKGDMIKRIPVVLNYYKNEGIHNFLELVISGRTNVEIFKNLKTIAPVRRVEIRNMETLKLRPIAETTETITPETPATPVQENLPSETPQPSGNQQSAQAPSEQQPQQPAKTA